jgi:hypothetical protein
MKAKKGKHALRFDPLARPAVAPRGVGEDEDEDEAPVKKLSAHQQRHLERKRAQAETEALRNQKRKVSKASKLEHQRETKAISAQLKASKHALHAASLHVRSADAPPAPAAEAKAAAEDAPAPLFAFNLPTPQGGARAGIAEAASIAPADAPMFGAR